MPTRSSEPLSGVSHGEAGYKKGCGCMTCRRGHRESMNKYNAAQRAKVGKPNVPKAGAEPGAMELAALRQIEALRLVGTEADMLVTLAQANARAIDIIIKEGRSHLLSSSQKNLLEVMDRLKALSAPAKAGADPEEDNDDFLGTLGSPLP